MPRKIYRKQTFSSISDAEKLVNETDSKIAKFLYQYISCEITCKKIISLVDHIPIKDTRMDVRIINRCLRIYGLTFSNEIINSIFSSHDKLGQRSCKVLRNRLVHGLEKKVLTEINDRYDRLNENMDIYLYAIKNGF